MIDLTSDFFLWRATVIMTLFIADKNRVSLLLQRKDKNTPKGLCYKKDWTWTEQDFKKKEKTN